MIERFETISGSIYEVDHDRKMIRRLSGTHDPKPRQGPDGTWKKYEGIAFLQEGSRAVIVWRIVKNGAIAESTLTSTVVKCGDLVSI